jgi:hypothetical protein
VSLSTTQLTVVQGNTGTVTVSTTTLSGAPQNIVLSLASGVPSPPPAANFTASSGISPQPSQPAWVGTLPPGVSGSFSPATITSGGSSTLTLTVSPYTPLGTYNLQVIATGAAVVRVDEFQLIVAAGTAAQDFAV